METEYIQIGGTAIRVKGDSAINVVSFPQVKQGIITIFVVGDVAPIYFDKDEARAFMDWWDLQVKVNRRP